MINIEDFSKIISEEIEKILEKEQSTSNLFDIDLKYFIKYITNNSKKIRAYLVYIGYVSSGKMKITKDLINVACAMEIFHSSLLIHDDIIDNSSFRRGNLSFHKKYEEDFKSERKGINYAIVIGDFGLFLAMKLISSTKSKFGNEMSLNFTEVAIKTIFGEIFDFYSDIDIISKILYEDILQICNYKTAFYTIKLPLNLGQYISESNDIDIFKEYSYNLGLIYQIKDDLDEIFLPFEDIGKDTFNDIKEGKINSVLKLTLDLSGKKDSAYLKSLLKGRVKLDEERVRVIIKNSGTYDFLLKNLQKYSQNAIESVSNINISNNSKKYLLELVESMYHN